MGDDENIARSSLLLAGHDHAHREHLHQHQHHHFHKRQPAPAAPGATDVIQTVSVLKQIDVDSSGHTLSVETITDRTSPSSPAVKTHAHSATRPPKGTSHTTTESTSSSQPPFPLPPSPVLSSTPNQGTSTEPPTAPTETPSPAASLHANSETSGPTGIASTAPSESEPSSQPTLLSIPIPTLPLILAGSTSITSAPAPSNSLLTTPLATVFTSLSTASFSPFIVPHNSTTCTFHQARQGLSY